MRILPALVCLFCLAVSANADDVLDRVEHGYTDSNGVCIHQSFTRMMHPSCVNGLWRLLKKLFRNGQMEGFESAFGY